MLLSIGLALTPLLLLVADAAAEGESNHFSGVYNPTCKYALEIFAGAWLMHAHRFSKASTLESIKKIHFIEAHTLYVAVNSKTGVLGSTDCEKGTQHMIMTRDYFDFFVEHLSSTLNTAESDDITDLLINRTAVKTKHLGSLALSKTLLSHFFSDTIAIIPFALVSGLSNMPSNDKSRTLRLLFFECTFWSLFRYFPHVAVSVSRREDHNALLSLNLPLFHVFASYDDGNKRGVHYNVQQALLKTHHMMSMNSTWMGMFQYVYFTEGDSVLHMRSRKSLHEVMSSPGLGGEAVLVPHRMQVPFAFDTVSSYNCVNSTVVTLFKTMPIPNNLPESSESIPFWKRQALKNAQLITLPTAGARGSCCDDGRYFFKHCGNWWYNCQEYGLKNLSTWMRFGKNGFTMSITEHQGRCIYHKEPVKCEIPTECTNDNSAFPRSLYDVCREIPSIESNDPAVLSRVFHRDNTK